MSNTSTTIIYPDISPTLLGNLSALANEIGAVDRTWSAALSTLAQVQQNTAALVAQVQESSQGQFVAALANLWGGATAEGAQGVSGDGSNVAQFISMLQVHLRTLQASINDQLPAISDGLNAIAQAQVGPSTECVSGGGGVEWSPDQAADLQQRINGLTGALETLNGLLFSVTANMFLVLEKVNPAVCASGITPGDPTCARRIFHVDSAGIATPVLYGTVQDPPSGDLVKLPNGIDKGNRGGGGGNGGGSGGDGGDGEEEPDEGEETPRPHRLKDGWKALGRWIDGDKNALWWQELIGKFIVGTGIETAKVGGTTLSDLIRTGHFVWHWNWTDWGVAVTATSLGYQAKVIFKWEFPRDKWGQLLIAFLLDDITDPAIHRLID